MQASGRSELKERTEERGETLDVFPGLAEVRGQRMEVRERIASRRPQRRLRALHRSLLTVGAVGLVVLGVWQTLSRTNDRMGAPSSRGAASLAAEQRLSGSDPPLIVETGPAPFTVVMGESPSVEMAPALRRAIRRSWPGYRLRPASAIGTEALEELREEHPEARSPYAVSGDYNGDGRIDAAVLLKKGSRALLVALHATPNGRYEGYVLERGPWVDGLYLLPQAPGPVEYTAARDDTRATAATLTLPAPAVRFHPVEAGARVYYWQDGRYRSVEVGT